MDRRALLFVLALAGSMFFVNYWFGSKSETAAPKPKIMNVAPPIAQESRSENQEQFYVLENDYQQIVFSNLGGAVTEINLSLYSKENPKSVLRPISFDRTMAERYPQNDHFPSYDKDRVGGFYPLLRRSLYGNQGQVVTKVPSRLYAFNVVSEKGDSSIFNVRRQDASMIEFEGTVDGRHMVKTFSFAKNGDSAPYCLELNLQIDGDPSGLSLTSGVPEVEMTSGSSTPAIKYRVRRNQKPVIELLSLPKTQTEVADIKPDWISNSNGFLGVIIDPVAGDVSGFNTRLIPGDKDPSRITVIDKEHNLYPAGNYPGYEVELPLLSQKTLFRIFAGPYDSSILKKVDATFSDPQTGYNPSYIATQTFHGWFAFISEPFARFLFMLMKLFFQFTGSWGLSIILLTVALRVMLYPLNAWSIKSTLRMQEIAPMVTQIQERNKKDPKKAQMEIMQLYKARGANPMTGCFPILIQMPFLIGMFDLLKSSFELRGAGFIPGWIDNLSAPDVLFSWSTPIPFIGTSFHLLPILLGVVMYLQPKLSSTVPKDKPLTDQQKQQKMMGTIMAVVFTAMFYNFPSGLNLYWLSSMLLGMLQQWWMMKKWKPGISS